MKRDVRTRRAPRLLAALGFCVIGLGSSAARAVPPEFLRNLALHPSDPKALVVRYESAFGGLLFSRDGARTLQMVPGRTFYKYSLQRRVPMLIDGSGKLLLALDSGLAIDDGKGCIPPPTGSDASSSDPALQDLWVADIAPHPGDPDTVFVVTTGDTMGKHSGLWRRNKQGMTSPIGMSAPAPTMAGQVPFIAASLKVVARAASTDGVRFLVAGTQYDYSTQPMTSSPVLRVSDDLGMTWTTHKIPDPTDTKGSPLILVVDGSSDAFKAIVALETGFGDNSADPMDPLYVTKDGGSSFTPYLDMVQVAGEAVRLPSGQILIADRGTPGGLWSAASFDAAPSKVVSDYAVHCLAYQPQTQKLFMCKAYEVGFYDTAANTFCALSSLKETTAFVSCPSAPLETNTQGIDQLCGGFCGAAHFASAPVCATFTVAPGRICGPSAYEYDNQNSDPDKRWIEPPGSLAAQRCPADPVDAGVSDAGGSDAGAEPTTPEDDASVAEEDAGGEPKKKPGGCQLAPAGQRAELTLALFALLAGLMMRRQRRRG